jgi:glutathione S-transferase
MSRDTHNDRQGGLVLYHVPPSFYSQIARIALAEKGLEYESRYVLAGPPTFESYEPWYMRLNPGGTVPTLVHRGKAVDDSSKIIHYIDQKFGGYALIPNEDGFEAEVEGWLEKLRAISVRELSYGSDRLSRLGRGVNGARLKRLRKLAKSHPELREAYEAKAADIESFTEASGDHAEVDAQRAKVAVDLDQMEGRLKDHEWLAGPRYTMADAVWTVGIARFHMLGIEPLKGRPALEAWYERMKERPSFDDADIWESFKPTGLLKVIASKLFG